LAAAISASAASAQSTTGQITVLYDAFGKTSTMTKDWGFAALVEYGGKRILFDTGNNAEIFAHNVGAKSVDLRQLDFAIVSHRHGDHTSGLNHLLKVNPAVKIYAPQENFGCSVPLCQAPSTSATSRFLRTCGISTENRRTRFVSAVRGPKLISPG
jgi:7,8-dihydropterin-6-yl-methyl-4-(beta-D-ribofuranosyl)aminobenzene 5'-phosphate synthase